MKTGADLKGEKNVVFLSETVQELVYILDNISEKLSLDSLGDSCQV